MVVVGWTIGHHHHCLLGSLDGGSPAEKKGDDTNPFDTFHSWWWSTTLDIVPNAIPLRRIPPAPLVPRWPSEKGLPDPHPKTKKKNRIGEAMKCER